MEKVNPKLGQIASRKQKVQLSVARPQMQLLRTIAYENGHHLHKSLSKRFAQDNGKCWYMSVLQRPNFKDFFCILVASMRTESALGSYNPLKLRRVTQRLAINKKPSVGIRLRHCKEKKMWWREKNDLGNYIGKEWL